MKRIALSWVVLMVGLFVAVPAAASDHPGSTGKKVKVKGVVIEAGQDVFRVRDSHDRFTTVKLQPSTEIVEKRSNFLRQPVLFRKADIAPGLKLVTVGRQDSQGVLWAEKIKFTQDDLKVAQIVDASLIPVENQLQGLHETSGRLSGQVDELNEESRRLRSDLSQTSRTADEALQQANNAHLRIDRAENRIYNVENRFAELADYELGATTAVYFKAGSAVLSDEGKAKLDQFVETLGDTRGMLLEVTGFASADGSEAYNRKLSERRAQRVVQYLAEQHRLPLRLFVNPHGFGELLPAADNSTVEGRRLNRRAEVRILINRGLRARADVTG